MERKCLCLIVILKGPETKEIACARYAGCKRFFKQMENSLRKFYFFNAGQSVLQLLSILRDLIISIFRRYLCQARLGNTPPGLLLLKSFEAKLNRKTSKKDEVLSQVRDLIGI